MGGIFGGGSNSGGGSSGSGLFDALSQGLTNASNLTPGSTGQSGGPSNIGGGPTNAQSNVLTDPTAIAPQTVGAGAPPTGAPGAGTQSGQPQPSQGFVMPPAPQQPPQPPQPQLTGQPAPSDIATNPTAPDFPGMYAKAAADPAAAQLQPPQATDADMDQAAQEHPQGIGSDAVASKTAGEMPPAATGEAPVTPAQAPAAAPTTPGSQGPATPGGAAAPADQQGGQYSPYEHPRNMLQALVDLFFRGPGAFQQDLEGLNKQVGGWYGTPRHGSQGYTPHGAGYGAPETAPTQPAASPAAPVRGVGPTSGPTSQQAPGWAGQAVNQGFDAAAAQDRQQPAQVTPPAPSAASATSAQPSPPGAPTSPDRPAQQADGSVTPTNGMPGGTTQSAPPPSPNYGAQQAAADNQNRPFHYTTQASVEGGGTYSAGSGGGQFASLPYGRFHYHPKAIGSIGHRIGAVGGISDSNNAGDNTVHDTRYGHHIRAGVEVHPDVSGGRLRTNGCIGIDKKNFSSFKRDIDRLSAKGPVDIINSPQGIRFVPSGIQGLPSEAPARIRQAPPNYARGLTDQQANELGGIVNTTAQLAPGGVPWEQWRRSTNVDPTVTSPEMQEGTGLEELAHRNWMAMGQSPYKDTQMARQLGIGDMDTALDLIARQMAEQTMRTSRAPSPINPPF